MTTSPGDGVAVQGHTDFAMAEPTPEYFIPLLYMAGLASAAGETAHVLVDGYAMGSLSMVPYALGCPTSRRDTACGGSPALPKMPGDATIL